MKKFLCLMLSLVMLLSISAVVGLTASAETSGDFEYSVLEDGTASITKYNGNAGDVNIPEYIDGYKVTNLGYLAFDHNNNIINVSIPGTVTTIERNAFLGCKSIKSLFIPGSVQTVKYSAFGECTSLKNVIFEDGVRTLSQWAFEGCTSLISVVFPKSVENIGLECFIDCTSLKYAVVLNEKCEILQSFCASRGEGRQPLTDFIVYGYKNSTAHTYALENGYNFVLIDEPIIDNSSAEYTVGSNGTATIHCFYDLSDFVSAEIDGAEVDPSNYTLSEGSTVITFAPSYLDTLSVGKHTVTLNYTNTAVTCALTVKGAQGEPSDAPGGGSAENSTEITQPQGTASGGSSKAVQNSNTDTSFKSPDTGVSYSGVVAVAGAAIISTAVLVMFKKKKQ